MLGSRHPIVPQTGPDVFTGQQAKHRGLFVSFRGRACYRSSWKDAEQHKAKMTRARTAKSGEDGTNQKYGLEGDQDINKTTLEMLKAWCN